MNRPDKLDLILNKLVKIKDRPNSILKPESIFGRTIDKEEAITPVNRHEMY